MKIYPLTQGNKDQERVIIQQILRENGCQQQIAYPKQKHKPPTSIPHDRQKTKWATFTYYGPDTRTIKKLFRNTDIKIAYNTTNAIKHHLNQGRNHYTYII
jgi:hypothetical protein